VGRCRWAGDIRSAGASILISGAGGACGCCRCCFPVSWRKATASWELCAQGVGLVVLVAGWLLTQLLIRHCFSGVRRQKVFLGLAVPMSGNVRGTMEMGCIKRPDMLVVGRAVSPNIGTGRSPPVVLVVILRSTLATVPASGRANRTSGSGR
jgi:hypothetical protein